MTPEQKFEACRDALVLIDRIRIESEKWLPNYPAAYTGLNAGIKAALAMLDDQLGG